MSDTRTVSKNKRVVIVGAGPTGLSAALGLAQRGASVTVIDAEPKINDSARAMVYFPSTLQVLDKLGVLEDAKKVGAWSWEYNLRFGLTGNIGRLSYHTTEGKTPYSYNLHFGQHILAQIILDHFVQLPGTEMRWGTEFTGFEQQADAVLVKVKTASGEQTIEADWLVGADGGRSAVRKALGVEFDGFTWPDTFMATNVWYDFDKYGYAPSTMVQDPVHWAVVAKIDDQSLWRIAYGEETEISEETRLARIDEHYRALLPHYAAYEIERANSYRVHQRCASRFYEGRVLLAGDAAHLTNPIGGMGFTSGIQDANALIDLLGAVIDDQLGTDALDWYNYERRRCFLDIANPSAIEFKRRTQEGDRAKRLEDEANFMKIASDPEKVAAALLGVFQLSGREYRADWRSAYRDADAKGLGAKSTVGAHAGVDIEAGRRAQEKLLSRDL